MGIAARSLLAAAGLLFATGAWAQALDKSTLKLKDHAELSSAFDRVAPQQTAADETKVKATEERAALTLLLAADYARKAGKAELADDLALDARKSSGKADIVAKLKADATLKTFVVPADTTVQAIPQGELGTKWGAVGFEPLSYTPTPK